MEGAPHRAGGGRLANDLRDVTVRARLPKGNHSHGIPHGMLKVRA